MSVFPLLLAVAFGSEPPPFPEPFPAVEGQCEEASPLEGYPCRAVAVPTSQVADFLAWKTYGEEVAALYKIDVQACESRSAVLEQDLAAAQNPALTDQPGFNRWVGRGEGIALGIGVSAVAWIALTWDK
jgi:hypothetical protein